MIRILEYVGRYQRVRTGLQSLPTWAMWIVGILAIPGIILIALSILAFLASLLALCLLTVPAYRLLSALTMTRSPAQTTAATRTAAEDFIDAEVIEPSRPTRNIDVKIVE